MGTQKNRLNETVLLTTQNTCLNWWTRKYLQLYTHKISLSGSMPDPSTNCKVNLRLIVEDWTHVILVGGLCHMLSCHYIVSKTSIVAIYYKWKKLILNFYRLNGCHILVLGPSWAFCITFDVHYIVSKTSIVAIYYKWKKLILNFYRLNGCHILVLGPSWAFCITFDVH